MGPVAPVAPVGPATVDAAPVGPVGPVEPVGPVGPVVPVGPVAPVGPATVDAEIQTLTLVGEIVPIYDDHVELKVNSSQQVRCRLFASNGPLPVGTKVEIITNTKIKGLVVTTETAQVTRDRIIILDVSHFDSTLKGTESIRLGSEMLAQAYYPETPKEKG